MLEKSILASSVTLKEKQSFRTVQRDAIFLKTSLADVYFMLTFLSCYDVFRSCMIQKCLFSESRVL